MRDLKTRNVTSLLRYDLGYETEMKSNREWRVLIAH
jgi:hypothetical protein